MASSFHPLARLTVALMTGLSVSLLAQPPVPASQTAGSRVETPAGNGAPASEQASGMPGDAHRGAAIAVHDQLSITTLNEANFTVKGALVDADGTIDFPYLGRIKVAGLTVQELEADLKHRLSDGWLHDPQITIDLVQALSKKVLVTGQVRSPGAYPFAGQWTVMQAIVQAGSTTEAASDTAVILRANADGSVVSADQSTAAMRVPVDLHKLLDLGDMSQNYGLNDGDTVIVEKAEPAIVSGEVKSPGQIAVRRGLTVQQAVALAGGLTDKGKSSGIKIERPAKDPTKKPDEIEVKDWKTELVRAGDTIIVPRRVM
jgi:protein involved in polysaccharide export with SLBB domain